MRVLIVEDSETIVVLLKIYIGGWRVPVEFEQATDGRTGLQMARARTPDLIISDVKMPNMDGFELCEALRADERLKRVPFVLLTSLQDDATRDRARAVGVDAVLRKPVAPDELRETVGRYFNL